MSGYHYFQYDDETMQVYTELSKDQDYVETALVCYLR